MADNKGLPFGPPQEGGGAAEGGEFVFRFRLDQMTPDEIGYDDPLLELVRGQLADLLDVAVLTYHGEPVMVDGFRLTSAPGEQYEVFPQKPKDASGQTPT